MGGERREGGRGEGCPSGTVGRDRHMGVLGQSIPSHVGLWDGTVPRSPSHPMWNSGTGRTHGKSHAYVGWDTWEFLGHPSHPMWDTRTLMEHMGVPRTVCVCGTVGQTLTVHRAVLLAYGGHGMS